MPSVQIGKYGVSYPEKKDWWDKIMAAAQIAGAGLQAKQMWDTRGHAAAEREEAATAAAQSIEESDARILESTARVDRDNEARDHAKTIADRETFAYENPGVAKALDAGQAITRPSFPLHGPFVLSGHDSPQESITMTGWRDINPELTAQREEDRALAVADVEAKTRASETGSIADIARAGASDSAASLYDLQGEDIVRERDALEEAGVGAADPLLVQRGFKREDNPAYGLPGPTDFGGKYEWTPPDPEAARAVGDERWFDTGSDPATKRRQGYELHFGINTSELAVPLQLLWNQLVDQTVVVGQTPREVDIQFPEGAPRYNGVNYSGGSVMPKMSGPEFLEWLVRASKTSQANAEAAKKAIGDQSLNFPPEEDYLNEPSDDEAYKRVIEALLGEKNSQYMVG